MPTEPAYTIGAAARLVGGASSPVPLSTMRAWSQQYASHLSEAANPPAGAERRYSDHDVAVLRQIHEWREARIPPADIAARLQDATIPIMTVLPAVESTESPGESIVEPVSPLQLPAPVLNDIVGRLQGFERLEGRIDKLESQRSMILLAVLAFAAGAVVVAVVVWLVSIVR